MHKDTVSHILRDTYGIDATAVTPASRGFYGETWQVAAPQGRYFVKSVSLPFHQPLYARSFQVMDALRRRGIDSISRVVPTQAGALYTQVGGATLGVFDWIDGENVQNEETKLLEYDILARVYAVSGSDLPIPREDFGMADADLFYAQWARLKEGPDNGTAAAILALFDAHEDTFARRRERLAAFSRQCRADTAPQFVTHGDAGGNILLDGARAWLVDWDDPVYAPPERDAWFCLHWDWAMRAFEEALARHGIAYTLRPERLAYYCYKSFFWYMTLYLQTFFACPERADLADALAGYLGCWIEENIRYADGVRAR